MRYTENLEWVYLGGPPIENIYDSPDYKPREKDLQLLEEIGRLGYDIPINDTVRVAIIEVDGKLYDSNNRIKIEDSIRKILVYSL